MRRAIFAALIAACASTALNAEPTPKERLLVPPPHADHYVVIWEGRKHGDEWRWTYDRSVAYREFIRLRGLVFDQDEVVWFRDNGIPSTFVIRGVTPSGDATETFAMDDAMAGWKTPAGEGEARARPGALYYPFGGAMLAMDALVPSLLRAGAKGVDLFPSGHATLQPSRKLTVYGPQGAKAVQLYFLTGVKQSPLPIWLEENGTLFGEKGKLFGIVSALTLLPAGYESNMRAMRLAQNAAIAELAPAIAHVPSK